MTNQRDSSDLLVPIDEAIREAEQKIGDILWNDSGDGMGGMSDFAKDECRALRRWAADMRQRRDAGETHEVMF